MAYYVPQPMATGSNILSPPPGTVSANTNSQVGVQLAQTASTRIQGTPPQLPPPGGNGVPTSNGYIATFIQSPTNEPKNAIFSMPPGSNVFQYPTPPLQLTPQNGNTTNVVQASAHPISNSHYVSTPPSSCADPSIISNGPKQTSHRPTMSVGGHKNSLITSAAPNSIPLSTPQTIKNTSSIFRTPNIISNGIPSQINMIPNSGQHEITYTTSTHHNSGYYDRKKIQPILNRKATNGPVRTNIGYNQYVPHALPPSHQTPNPASKNVVPLSNTSSGCTNGSYGEHSSNVITDKRSMINSSHASNICAKAIIPNMNAGTEKTRGPRPKLPSLDFRRNVNSNRNTPSTNSTESNNSPNSIVSLDHQPLYHVSRGAHIPTAMANSLDACQSLACNPATGMYLKLGQAYFSHVSDLFCRLININH